jgi:hypothetical protein
MKQLDELLDNYHEKCKIDARDLSRASLDVPLFHSKFLRHLASAKLLLKKAELDQKKILKLKWLYYNGKMDQETLNSLGWDPDPFDGLKVLKGELDYYYDSDPEIQKSEEKIHYYKTMVDTLSNIVDTLKWRHQTIKNMIDWKKFESGS